MTEHLKAMQKAGLSLAIIAFISVLLVSTTNKLTEQKIAKNRAMMLLRALNQVAPKSSYDNDLIKSKIIIKTSDTGFSRDTPVYLATKNNVPSIAIFEATTLKGYSGVIKIIIGIRSNDLSISGVRIVQHKETPGLGDKMDIRKSDWVMSFNGKSLGNPTLNQWQVKKDGGEFEQFTGATITPRAIVNAVKSTLLYAQDNMQTLFKKTHNTRI
ncbi:MAG: electron transport complex subunit RsxG [Cocleimonas sp.]